MRTISLTAALFKCYELKEARRKWDTEEGRAEIRGIDAVMCALHNLPTVQPRRGTWRDWDGKIVTNGYCAICSACGEESEYLTDYCPNCGADMRGTWEVSK